MFTNFLCQLNDPSITGRTTLIRLHQFQSYLYLPDTSLNFWPFNLSLLFYDPIADLLSVLSDFHLSFNINSSWSNKIHGGSTHVSAILDQLSYIKALPSLKAHRIMFVEQLVNFDGIYLINW